MGEYFFTMSWSLADKMTMTLALPLGNPQGDEKLEGG